MENHRGNNLVTVIQNSPIASLYLSGLTREAAARAVFAAARNGNALEISRPPRSRASRKAELERLARDPEILHARGARQMELLKERLKIKDPGQIRKLFRTNEVQLRRMPEAPSER